VQWRGSVPEALAEPRRLDHCSTQRARLLPLEPFTHALLTEHVFAASQLDRFAKALLADRTTAYVLHNVISVGSLPIRRWHTRQRLLSCPTQLAQPEENRSALEDEVQSGGEGGEDVTVLVLVLKKREPRCRALLE